VGAMVMVAAASDELDITDRASAAVDS
jgi:hypothetical protein